MKTTYPNQLDYTEFLQRERARGRKKKVLPGLQGSKPWVLTNYTIEPFVNKQAKKWPYRESSPGQADHNANHYTIRPCRCQQKRSWSSGYDRRLPSDGPGFNSRRAHFFVLQKTQLKRSHSSLGVEHSLSKRKVVGSNPACGCFLFFEQTPWRNGNASDSRPEDWGFDSLWGHFLFFAIFCLQRISSKNPR